MRQRPKFNPNAEYEWIGQAVAMRECGESYVTISMRLGVPQSWVQKMLTARGVAIPQKKIPQWTARDDIIIGDKFREKMKDQDIGALLSPPRGAKAVKARRSVLGLSYYRNGAERPAQPIDTTEIQPVESDWAAIHEWQRAYAKKQTTLQGVNAIRLKYGLSPFAPSEPLAAWIKKQKAREENAKAKVALVNRGLERNPRNAHRRSVMG